MPDSQQFDLWKLAAFNAGGKLNTWFVSRRDLDALGVSCRSRGALVRAGQVAIQAKIEEAEEMGLAGTLRFSSDLMGSLSLPMNHLYRARAMSNGEVRIGPVVGVLISSKKRQRLAAGSNDSVYEQLTRRGDEYGALVSFFSPNDVEWGGRVVKAVLFDGNSGRYKPAVLPLPDVIYDRCFGEENRSVTYQFRKDISRWGAGVRIFNAMPKLGKWETWEALSRYSATADFMPETRLVHKGSDVMEMVNRYGVVYLKPDRLYKGKGVHRLALLENGKMELGYRGEDGNKDMVVSSWDEVAKYLMPFWNPEEGYLVQRGLKLAKYRGLPFDFRALCQKNIEGKWVTSAVAARIAATGAVITSPRSGGTVQFIEPALEDAFRGSKMTVEMGLREIDRVAHKTCSALEEAYGIFGELGLDMAFDRDCRLWIIEVNGKPLKVSLNRLGDDGISKRIIDTPMDYSVFLAGFSERSRIDGGGY